MALNINDLLSDGMELEYKGNKFKVQPLTLRMQARISALQQKEQWEEASTLLFLETLKKIFPDSTEEQILNINDKTFLNLVTPAILKVNGLDVKEPNFQVKNQTSSQ